jgi:RNA polymerase sigma-70 factor (ECF subfamily)
MRDMSSAEDDDTDARLLVAIAAGAEQAFVDLYRRRHADIFRFALAMAKSRAFAEDATQEVFLNVLEHAERFDATKGSARGWLLGCARHVVVDRLRLERRWTDAVPEQVVASQHDERLFVEQRIERLHAALAELPVEYREAVVLCDLAELSYADAAIALGCPLGTVRSRLHRGRALLTSWLGEHAEREAGRVVAAVVPSGEGVCT